MNDILNKAMVLVLNRNWQAVNVRTPQEAFCMMATNVATGLEIEGENHIRPVIWDEWITLHIRPQDHSVRTVRGPIRVPTVIVAVNYAKVPKKRPKLCARAIRERDGNRCQYTGRVLRPDEGSLDHVRAPLARRQERLGEPGLGRQGRERPQGQPPATRGRPEAAEGAARAKGIAGLGDHSQCSRHSRMEAVRAAIK